LPIVAIQTAEEAILLLRSMSGIILRQPTIVPTRKTSSATA